MVRFKVGWGVSAGGKPGIWGPGQGNHIDSVYGALTACLTQCLQAFSPVTHPHTTSNSQGLFPSPFQGRGKLRLREAVLPEDIHSWSTSDKAGPRAQAPNHQALLPPVMLANRTLIIKLSRLQAGVWLLGAR